MLRNHWLTGLPLLAAPLLIAGCGGESAPQGPPSVPFISIEQATTPVTIEGILEPGTLRRQTGRPTEFELKEEASAKKLIVMAPDSQVPSNITTSLYVTAVGIYDATEKKFVATEVRTRVPNRSQQNNQ